MPIGTAILLAALVIGLSLVIAGCCTMYIKARQAKRKVEEETQRAEDTVRRKI